MKRFRFTLGLTYEAEADNEDDFIQRLVEDIKRNWIYYADEGDIEELGEVKTKLKGGD